MARRSGQQHEGETGLRIIAGANRGTRLRTPPGLLLRPMRDQVRGALFNILGQERVEGARVLDMFSGSGSLGLEAISRGAARAVCVDKNPACLDVLRQNVAHLRADDRVDVRRY
ncbi:MAG: RsmD family RNA methyltransferase, partial [Planctomycetota bacterium]|nr:RsmD family RNA methyltransferase [Planctomycetota bacterium]